MTQESEENLPTSAADRQELPPPLPKEKVKTRVVAAVKAAVTRPPSRLGDQAMFWGIRTLIEATKSLGFPVVVTFLVLYGAYTFGNKFIEAQNKAMATQQALLNQNNFSAVAAQDRGTAAIKEMAASQAESNDITRALMIEMGLNPPPKRRPIQPSR